MRAITLVLFLFIPFLAKSQFLDDPIGKEKAKQGINALYNQNFSKAETIFNDLKKSYVGHPLSDLLDAILIQNKYFPVEDNPKQYSNYFNAVQACIKSAEKLAIKDNSGPESTFFLLASYGYTALYYNDKGDKMKAGLVGKDAYSHLKKSFEYTEQNPEFYFTTGLYNYYRVQYPISHPIIKPIMSFFKGGNKVLGLSQLQKAISNSIFSKVEASYYLINIYIKYESNFSKAAIIAKKLYTMYPNNTLFKVKYGEALVLNKQYKLAEPIVESLSKETNASYKIAYYTLKGKILTSQNLPDNALAFHANALKINSKNETSIEFKGISYLEMAKIFEQKNDRNNAKIFFNKALETSEYNWVLEEAKTHLSNNF